jgi:hypothetical protein
MECFVCADGEGELHRVCKCPTRVHAACFARLVGTVPAHHYACPVCTAVYVTRTRVHMHTLPITPQRAIVSACMCTLLVVSQLFSAILYVHATRDAGWPVLLAIAMWACTAATMCGFVAYQHCILWIGVRVARHLVLPPPEEALRV